MKTLCLILLLIATLPFSGCKKEDVGNDMNVADCKFDHLQLSVNTHLSDQTGRIVEMKNPQGQTTVRIQYKGADTFLDPCKLPNDIAVGQKVRFSGTLFNILNTEHMNLDLFPLELSTIEIIAE